MRILSIVALVGFTSAVAAAPDRKSTVALALGRDAWTVTAPGAKHTQPSKHGHRFTTKTWSIDVKEWPRSSVFLQTLDEQRAATMKRAPHLVVLRADKRAVADWQFVAAIDGTVHGVVMRPGRGSNAMCTFQVAPKHWRVAVAACETLGYMGPIRHGS